jgi:hypothetical protein
MSNSPPPSSAEIANEALKRIAILCTQHMDRDCNHRMALDAARQIANDVLDVAQGALLWRVPRLVGDALSLSRWNYFDNEEDAGCEAQALGTDYEEVRIVLEAAQPLSAVAQPAPKYDLRAFARFLYEHCALDPDKAGDVAATILSEYTVWPDDSAAQPPAAPVDLTDPVVVHANMLRGTIAKPTWEQIKHLYPEQFQSSAASERTEVSIVPMALSDGRTDYFVSIKVGERVVTPHVFREEFKAAYHVALYDWLLNGAGEEPDCIEFGPDDWPARVPRLSAATEREVIAQALCGADGNGFLQDCTDIQVSAYMLRADAVISVQPQGAPLTEACGDCQNTGWCHGQGWCQKAGTLSPLPRPAPQDARKAAIEECAALMQRWSSEAAEFADSDRCRLQANLCRNAAQAIRNLASLALSRPHQPGESRD